ncbi:two-component system response regulator DevR [Rhodococcus sp. 27YEA15]|uniref:response regulator n=1 Tax=Rhodococcus sp. 27YEA15 TaxID=3156259 RepID=UPI003C7A05A0
MDQTSVLIVEDHPVVRLGLRTLIDAQDDLTVVAEVSTSDQAIAKAREFRPAVAVMPMRLSGDFVGVELCRDLKSSLDVGSPRVLVYTSYNSSSDTAEAYLSGADSFVYKGESAGRLLDSLRATAAGQRVWLVGTSPEASASWLSKATEGGSLTRREHEILGLMLQRSTNAEIAHELFIELSTVKSHVRNVLRKLGLATRRDLH